MGSNFHKLSEGVEEELLRRSGHLKQQIIVLGSSAQVAGRSMLAMALAMEELGAGIPVLDEGPQSYHALEVSPFYNIQRPVQNNDWRGKGKRKKGKPK